MGEINDYRTGFKRVSRPFQTGATVSSNGLLRIQNELPSHSNDLQKIVNGQLNGSNDLGKKYPHGKCKQ